MATPTKCYLALVDETMKVWAYEKQIYDPLLFQSFDFHSIKVYSDFCQAYFLEVVKNLVPLDQEKIIFNLYVGFYVDYSSFDFS